MERRVEMKKKMAYGILLVFLLSLCLVGCSGSDEESSESGIPGQITSEVGSMADYIGWWQLEETAETTPFVCVEIPKDNAGVVRCYNERGEMIDTGYTDYSEQRALNGNPLIVFTFNNIGEFGATEARLTDGERWLSITFDDIARTFYYQSESPFGAEGAMEVLAAALGDKLDGKMLVETGEDAIDGVTCKTFSLGTNQSDNFVSEEHFAVSPDGDIYTMDVLQGADWLPYQ